MQFYIQDLGTNVLIQGSSVGGQNPGYNLLMIFCLWLRSCKREFDTATTFTEKKINYL